MDDDPLLGLHPSDPQNLLSIDARRRVARAHIEADRIKWEAEAHIDAHLWGNDSPRAFAARQKAGVKAARTVLRTLQTEYSQVCSSLDHFRACMKEEIEGAIGSLELSQSQRHAFEHEFYYPIAKVTELAISKKRTLPELRDDYLARFEEKIVILDVCWAAKQRYREWKRWIGGELKSGSKPDRAFRAILTSKKRPEEYRLDPRPKGWK